LASNWLVVDVAEIRANGAAAIRRQQRASGRDDAATDLPLTSQTG
jgi:hypothetical protein